MTQQINESYLDRLKAVECRDSTYLSKDPALVFERGLGSIVVDVAGKEYIDLCAGFGVLALGHNSSRHRAVMQDYFGASGSDSEEGWLPPVVHAMGDVYPSKIKVELLETLMGMLPVHFSKAALALSGGQAVELAVKTAILATKQSGFICFEGAYHGLDIGILPLTARQDFREPFKAWNDQERISCLPFMCDADQVEAAMQQLASSKYGLAGIMVEPVQGRAGVRLASLAWLQELRDLCDRYKVPLIYDEVFTGLGRAGQLTFAELVPCDLLCLGKALGGGLPLSACVGTEQMMLAWPESQGEALHTGTFFGHPLACALGKATLEALQTEDLSKRSLELGAWLREHLAQLFRQHGLSDKVKDIRGVGLMSAVELYQAGSGAKIMDLLRQEGVIALASGPTGESLTFSPALNIPQALLMQACERITKVIKQL